MTCNCETLQDTVYSCSRVWLYIHNFLSTKPWRRSVWTEKCGLSIVIKHQVGKRGKRLAKYDVNKDAVGQVAGVPFAEGKEAIRSYLRQEHQARWVACHGWHQSNTLMSHPLQSTESELLQSRLTLKVAVGLLAGHSDPRAHLFNLELSLR